MVLLVVAKWLYINQAAIPGGEKISFSEIESDVTKWASDNKDELNIQDKSTCYQEIGKMYEKLEGVLYEKD